MTTDEVSDFGELTVSRTQPDMSRPTRTTIMIYDEEKDALDRYAEQQFGHSDVPYRSTLKSLLHEAGASPDDLAE